ncbi:hypothetical protein [Bradyrhizobium sp. STM 3809]|uniref:hypothetical protein n=1 Tax=Bradyrhizobium sp. STM 3809 TaxID=551936 RepID=UPI0002407D01|nr:hypothetical protein [Bradyrhizobium sp. STM 3809]CCE02716.1 conserved hypothetical protein [Bradyrhizobium sp. STM 3809]
MNPELPNIDRDKAVSPFAQEIEYALTLQRMIQRLTEDPAELRSTVYEFARSRLKDESPWLDAAEQERLATALETAIQGVERFETRRAEREGLAPPAPAAKLSHQPATAAEPAPSFPAAPPPITPASDDIILPERGRWAQNITYIQAPREGLLANFARFSISAAVIVGILAVILQRDAIWSRRESPAAAHRIAAPNGPENAPAANSAPPVAASPVPPPPPSLGFPIPGDYGIYAIAGDELKELELLGERVPDKRISISTPINHPSRTMLPDGNVRFVLFRRDLAGNAPERLELRVVARVARALSFDAKGKLVVTPVSDAWNIRSKSYELRLRPIANNPEMLLAQFEKPDFALPPGRYVLALRDQAYDFTVAGTVTESTQCLERTDAVNGSFYSECNTKP